MFNQFPVVIVAAMGKDTRALGKNNQLLWHIPADLKRFKQLTTGHPIIMGRKTFASIIDILGKPLPGRTNIVVTRSEDFDYPDIKIAHNLKEALLMATAENPTEIHIGGGAEIYTQALPYVDKIFLTEIHDNAIGDTFFPNFEEDFIPTSQSEVMREGELSYQWIDYTR